LVCAPAIFIVSVQSVGTERPPPPSLNREILEHDADSMNRRHAPRYRLSIAFAENRFPLFGAML
jgi:hypothetical protein